MSAALFFCRTGQPEEPVIQYDVSKPCNDTGVNVEANNSYRLTFVIQHPKAGHDVWRDASIPSVFGGMSSWRGWGHPLESAKFVAAAPFRGIVPARWLQPLYAIREKDGPDADRLGTAFSWRNSRPPRREAMRKTAGERRLILWMSLRHITDGLFFSRTTWACVGSMTIIAGRRI
ncbi:hypothetical protein [Sphingobium sp. Z007]|uniref:hypothetical protein n=1 Tax=Sphingobium sp. Z007 TaxID=627495 RepID=UPI001124D21F|nr:hypothetical protein [Sphingobium sp. Z007]